MITASPAVREIMDRFRAGQFGHSGANAAMFLRSCVAQALNREDEQRQSLHAFVQ